MSGAGIQALQRDLRELRQALDDEDLARAGTVLGEHDRRLRSYLAQVGTQAPLGALSELLDMQRALQADLQRARDESAAQLATLRRSSQATRQYREAAR